jgi:hypothetical protein
MKTTKILNQIVIKYEQRKANLNSIKVDPIKSQVTTTGTGVWTPKTN